MDHPTEYDKYRYDEYTVTGRISLPGEHLVEDVRSPKVLPKKPSEKGGAEKKIKKAKKKSRGILLAVMLTLLCFSATLFIADLLGDSSAISAYTSLFGKKKQATPDRSIFYAVYATHSSDMGVSYKNATAIRREGGAGYVMKIGEEYYVILNAYSSQSDAEKVAKKQANYEILEIIIPNYRAKEGNAVSAIEPYKDLYREAYDLLYESANHLAAGSYGEEDMKRTLRNYKERIAIAESNYAQAIRGKEETATIEYKVCLAEMRSAFENLLEHSTELVADARYYAVMILHSYSLFSEKHFGK